MSCTASHHRAWLLAVLFGTPGCPDGGVGVGTESSTTGNAAVATAEMPTTHGPTSPTGSQPTGPGGADMGVPEGFAPEPRWVLRDKDGVRVQALVEPRCGQNGDTKSS